MFGCVVLRSRNYRYRDVRLPDGVPVVVGRGPGTRIRERRCSKQQVQITVDYAKKKAVVLQLGVNPSEVDGQALRPQQQVEITQGSDINLLQGDFKYTLEFLESPQKPSAPEDPMEGAKRNVQECHGASKKLKNEPREEEEEGSNVEGEKSQRCLADEMTTLTTKEDRWEEYDHSKLFMFTPSGLRSRAKVAAFDLDHTLIGTKSGKVFPTSMDDWRILYAEIPGKLKKLVQEGYKILVFTNQKGISRGRTSAPDFKRKVESIVKRLGVSIQVMVSTGSGKYRKPNTGMWDYFMQNGNLGVTVDISSCVYVGDAAGRPDKWAPKKKKDFSCADRLFALNIGIKFYTPEEFFLGQKPAIYRMPVFDPRAVADASLAVKYLPPPEENVCADNLVPSAPEVIVCVGFPASGKTHFVKTYLVPKGYVHVNRDTLGSWQKCVSECMKTLSRNQKVVIDNTNPDVESRKRYIDCAKKARLPCRCFLFTCSLEQAKHNNVFRELQKVDEEHAGVNDMVMNSYKAKFKEPTLEEGFTELLKINFVPKFRNKHEERLFRRFLIEK